jgi:uncharacterized protein YaaQ
MTNGGKNAADFGICFFAGVLMQQLHKQTHFVIISNDTDLDHVVNLLKSQGRSAERISTKKEENKATTTTVTKTTVESSALVASVKSYCTQLVTYSQNRPASIDALMNNIRTKFKDSPHSVADIFSVLTTQGAITISGNKVSYNDHKIKEILK